ncbi:hypothetical protein [Cupriavidus sp. D384]|uniref:hypothetical protein n=1 Tax=Cupriavidus sp. D384 TaxID=1538095 RepID=UPI000ABA22E5|nr:hypothetical protein [Cupriavidus sp. D384]
MKAPRYTSIAMAALALGLSGAAQAQGSRYDALANAPFVKDYPTPETSRMLQDELLFQRATQAYLWALPAINIWAMKEGSEKVFGRG